MDDLLKYVLITVAVIGAALLITDVTGNYYVYNYEKVVYKEIDVFNDEFLDINFISRNIKIEKYYGDTIIVKGDIRGDNILKKDIDLIDVISVKNGDGSILITDNNLYEHLGINGRYSFNLEILVPDFIKLRKIKGVNLDILINKCHGKASVKSVSGDVTIKDYDDLNSVSTVSGDLKIDCKNINDIKTISGDVDLKTKSFRSIESISGDIKVYCEKTGDIRTISGDISTFFKYLVKQDVFYTTTSGDIVINFKKLPEYNISISGKSYIKKHNLKIESKLEKYFQNRYLKDEHEDSLELIFKENSSTLNIYTTSGDIVFSY